MPHHRRRWQKNAKSCYYRVVPPQKPFPCTLQQLNALRGLISQEDAGFSQPLRRRLLMLIGLGERKGTTEICKELGLSRQRIEKVRQEALSRGLDVEIANATRLKDEAADSASAKHGVLPGPPRISTLSAWEELQRPEEEPVIELISLVLAPTLQCAIFGSRPAKSEGNVGCLPRKGNIETLVKTAWKCRGEPDWTSSMLDYQASHLFDRLREEVRRMTDLSPDLELGFAEVCHECLYDYSAAWRFFILYEEGSQRLELEPSLSEPRVADLIPLSRAVFLNEVERLFYQLRVRENLQGLFPCFDQLRARVWDETLWTPVNPFRWGVSEKDVNAALARRQVEFRMYGLAGLAFELPSKLRTMIPWKDRFPIETLSLRPRIEFFEHAGRKTATVEYLPIPELGYRFVTKLLAESHKQAKVFRQLLRDGKQKLTFEYSVRVHEDQSPSAFPSEVAAGRFSEKMGQRLAIVSVPRQWLMEPPLIPLAEVVRFADFVTAPASRSKDQLWFHSPTLLEAIRRGFESNRYGDRLASIGRFDLKLAEGSPTCPRRLIGMSGPLYYFSPDELAGKNIDIRVLRRLCDCPIDYAAAKEFGNAGGTKGCLYPDYDPARVFRNLLIDYDADFLLREIEETEWKELVSLSESWVKLRMDVISERYWDKSGRPVEELVFRAIPSPLRESAKRMSVEVETWVSEAIPGFCSDTTRVLRHAIETAQRCLLSNLPPICAVVRSEKDVLRSWRSYLGQHLAGRIADEGGRQSEKVRGERAMLSKTERRAKGAETLAENRRQAS